MKLLAGASGHTLNRDKPPLQQEINKHPNCASQALHAQQHKNLHPTTKAPAPNSHVIKVGEPGKHSIRKHGQLIVVEVPAGNGQGAPPSA